MCKCCKQHHSRHHHVLQDELFASLLPVFDQDRINHLSPDLNDKAARRPIPRATEILEIYSVRRISCA
jgi:hypothetical protein